MNMTRRNFFQIGATSTGAALLAGCSISTKNGVTTIELNVGEVVGDTNVALAIAKTALGFTGVPAAIVTAVNTGITVIQTGLQSFKQTAGSTLVLTFNSNSIPDAFKSLIADLETVSHNIAGVAASESSTIDTSLMNKISSVSSDIGNVASILDSIISTVVGQPLSTGPVSAAVSRQMRIDSIKAKYGVV